MADKPVHLQDNPHAISAWLRIHRDPNASYEYRACVRHVNGASIDIGDWKYSVSAAFEYIALRDSLPGRDTDPTGLYRAVIEGRKMTAETVIWSLGTGKDLP